MAIPPNINNVEPIEQDLTLRLPQQLTQHLTKHFMSSHCHRPDCSWLSLDTLKNYTVAPPLRPDSEISGIGAILGFAITAYITLFLLIINYVFAFDPHRWAENGRRYTNPLDLKLLGFIRNSIKWRPSRRLEYSLERSVLILSDTQLITGLAILSSGYSQLKCGISAYHWQIMVYVAWFASFSFLSAMTFLQAFFQANHSLRIIRVCFIIILGVMMIIALLPTGSKNWMNLACRENQSCFFPSLHAQCFYQQMTMKSFNNGRTKMYSMVLSVLVVGLSYVSCGFKMFDPSSAVTRQYARVWPGVQLRRLLRKLNIWSQTGKPARISFRILYMAVYAAFTSARAIFDIMESMLGEILWLTFAIAWGTIKVWTTRSSAHLDSYGDDTDANPDVLAEDAWSFGQTLPLVLLLLPILSMAQVYFDNDTKILDAASCEQWTRETGVCEPKKTLVPMDPGPPPLSSIVTGGVTNMSERNWNPPSKRPSVAVDDGCACPISRCAHHPSQCPIPSGCTTDNGYIISSKRPSLAVDDGCTCPIARCAHHPSICRISQDHPAATTRDPEASCASSIPSLSSCNTDSPSASQLPSYLHPDTDPYSQACYCDHILLWILQLCLIAAFILWLLNVTENILGINFFLRNRLFLIWIFGILPSSLFLHLAFWQVATWVWVAVHGKQRWNDWVERAEDDKTKRRRRAGTCVYVGLRMFLVAGLVTYTFLLSFEAGGPQALVISLDDV